MRSMKQTPTAEVYSDYFQWESGLVDRAVDVTTEWRRYSLSGKLPASLNNAYAAGLTFTAPSAEVWMDAARVVVGSDDAYAPAARGAGTAPP
eukprot:gene7430-1170_t